MPDLVFRDLDYADHKVLLHIHELISADYSSDPDKARLSGDDRPHDADFDVVIGHVIWCAKEDMKRKTGASDFYLTKLAANGLLDTIAACEEEEDRRDRDAMSPKFPLDDGPTE